MYKDIEVEVMCVGLFEIERSGYYAGKASIENFKVFINNTDVTKILPKAIVAQLERDYLEHCLNEKENPADEEAV